jgi:hypothetical protein
MRRKTGRKTPKTYILYPEPLTFIRDHPGCRATALVPFYKYSGSKLGAKLTAAYVTRTLVAAGWVRKRPNPTRYWLTKKGLSTLAALPEKSEEASGPQSITLRAPGFTEWGFEVAKRLGVDPIVVADLYWSMNFGCDKAGKDRLVSEDLWSEGQGLTEKGKVLADETMAACVRWLNRLSPDADLSFVKRECGFVLGDIVEAQGQRYRVISDMGYNGWVEKCLPGADGTVSSTFMYWLCKGELCRKIGHEG